MHELNNTWIFLFVKINEYSNATFSSTELTTQSFDKSFEKRFLSCNTFVVRHIFVGLQKFPLTFKQAHGNIKCS